MAIPLLSNLLPTNNVPQPGVVPLDADTQHMIDNVSERAADPNYKFAEKLNAGVQEGAKSLGGNAELASQADQREGASPHMGEAIRNAYSAQSNDSVSRLMRSNQHRAELMKADQLKRAAQMRIAQQRVAAQNNATLVDAYNQQEMARAGFIQSIFQGAATGMAISAAHSKPAETPKDAQEPIPKPAPNLGGFKRSVNYPMDSGAGF